MTSRLHARRGFLAAIGVGGYVACAGPVRSQEGETLPEEAPPPELAPAPRASFATVGVTLEVARTNEERARGLGGHAPLGETEGMLFVFERPAFHSFWMKGMLFPLDLIWIENGVVVHIERDAPHFPAGTPDIQLPIYAPLAPASYVLEVNAGFTASYGIEVGSQVELVGI